jgi:putative component of membrane protein insertase Oxa1/YidC/SpoIIIJ protein YidD
MSRTIAFVAMRAIVLHDIRFYQRHLSPLKGFRCAYRVHTGRCSCSTLGFRAIRRYGVARGIPVLRLRMYLCGVAHRRFGTNIRRSPQAQSQAGFVDVDCGAADVGSSDGGGSLNALDFSSCSDTVGWLDAWTCCDASACDFPESRRRNREKERYIHVPPNSMRRSQGGEKMP